MSIYVHKMQVEIIHKPSFLGLQILVRAQEAKIIEEKAAKIKDWVTFKLREVSAHMYRDTPDCSKSLWESPHPAERHYP